MGGSENIYSEPVVCAPAGFSIDPRFFQHAGSVESSVQAAEVALSQSERAYVIAAKFLCPQKTFSRIHPESSPECEYSAHRVYRGNKPRADDLVKVYSHDLAMQRA